MKKLMLLLAVFAGISMLSAAELSADGWIKSQMQGKFVFTNPGKYPISMKCDEPSAGKAVKEVGIWGRYLRHEKVETGKSYEVKVTYKFTGDDKAQFVFWLRGAAVDGISRPKSAEPRTFVRKFTAKSDKVTIYLNMLKGAGELEIISVELNKVD